MAELAANTYNAALPAHQTAWGYRARDVELKATVLSNQISHWSEEAPEHEQQKTRRVVEWAQGLQKWAHHARMCQLSAIEQKTCIRILSGLKKGLDKITDKSARWHQLEQFAVSYLC